MTDETPPAEPKPAPAEEPTTRAKNLYYVGALDPVSGEPVEYVQGVPARDLSEEDIRVLSDDEYRVATSLGLYQKSKPKGG